MNLLWTNYERTMNELWTNYERTMNELWIYYERTMNELWTNYERTMNERIIEEKTERVHFYLQHGAEITDYLNTEHNLHDLRPDPNICHHSSPSSVNSYSRK